VAQKTRDYNLGFLVKIFANKKALMAFLLARGAMRAQASIH